MEAVNQVDNLSVTSDYLSMEQFIGELEVKHQSRNPSTPNIYAVFQQKETQRSILDSYKTSPEDKQRFELVLIEFRKKLSTSLPYLVQFWEPVSVGARRYLITSELPFSIYNTVDQGTCPGSSYRKKCMAYRYSADWEDVDSRLVFGPPGRVFLQRTSEFNKITDYSIYEYPFRDFALTCQGDEILFVPVYEPRGGRCIGVAEYIIFGNQQGLYEHVFQEMEAVFQSAKLMLKEWPWPFSGESEAVTELKKVLEYVCEEESIPLARVWRPNRDPITNNIVYSSIQEEWHKKVDNRYYSINTECEKHRHKQVVVGQAFSSFTSDFCRNLTRLSTYVHPLALDASDVDSVSSFAMCLRHSSNGYRTFILEFFFSKFKGDWKLVRNVLDKIKDKFPNLKFHSPYPNDPASCRARHISETTLAKVPPETEVFHSLFKQLPEVVISQQKDIAPSKVEMFSDQPSVETAHSFDILPKHIDPGEVDMTFLDQPLVTTREMMPSYQQKDIALRKVEMLSYQPSVPTARNFDILPKHIAPGEVDMMFPDQPSVAPARTFDLLPKHIAPCEVDMMFPDQHSVETAREFDLVPKHIAPGEVNMLFPDQPSVATPHSFHTPEKDIAPGEAELSANKPPVANAHNNVGEMEVSITLEVLRQHAVAKLELVARHLQVSPSTFKRICRKYGIENWLSFRRATAKGMRPDSLRAAEEHIKHRYCNTKSQDFSLFNDHISSVEIVESIRKEPRIQNLNNVTVKASYEGDMKRLEFSLMTKFADLVEEMAKRFSLQSNSFKIKYEDEDGDWVVLETDKELSACFSKMKSFRNNIVYVKIEKICSVSF